MRQRSERFNRWLGYYSFMGLCFILFLGGQEIISHLMRGISKDFGEGMMAGISIFMGLWWVAERAGKSSS